MLTRCLVAAFRGAVALAAAPAADHPVVLTPEEMEQSLAGTPAPGDTGARGSVAHIPPPAGDDTPSVGEWDQLPLSYADMDEYERIAMEPYRDTYDGMAVAEKAALYARQFEFMHGRSPVYPPEVTASLQLPAETVGVIAGSGSGGKGRRQRNKPRPATGAATLGAVPNHAAPDAGADGDDPIARAMAHPGPYDPLPLTMAAMARHDRIAMEPYRETYDDLPLAEQAERYAQQFTFMNDRPPNYHPSVVAAMHGLPYEPRGDESTAFLREAPPATAPVSREPAAVAVPAPAPSAPARSASGAGSLRPPPPPPPSYDDFPRRMAEMDRTDRIAMEPHREHYDTMPLTERAVVYAKQFKRLHGRFPKFHPEVMAEIGLSQYNSVDLEAMGLKELADTLRARAGEQYDELPRSLAEMGTDARNALDVYRFSYDRFSLPEKATVYAVHFEKIYGRPPRYSPATQARIERVRQGLPEVEPEEAFAWSDTEAGDGGTLPVHRAPPPGGYDALPRRMAEMTRYDRIAMEPYKDSYDGLPLAEKARLYARQFESMQGRPPVFSPETEEEILAGDAAPSETGPARKSPRDFYKEPAGRARKLGMDPMALPGPWNPNAQAGSADAAATIVRNPDGTPYQPIDDRMESLRGGWNLLDMEPELGRPAEDVMEGGDG